MSLGNGHAPRARAYCRPANPSFAMTVIGRLREAG